MRTWRKGRGVKLPADALSARLENFEWQVRLHLDAATDYIWKTPEFLELQERVELEKLEDYADDPAGRHFRWEWESHSLYSVFPTLMATSNLFISLSLFEFYLLRLALICSDQTGRALQTVSGQGVQQSLRYLRALGINTAQPEYWPQIDAGLKIRHCLMHASGLLIHSREATELRRIVRSRTYLSQGHRRSVPDTDADVSIVTTPLGERVKIDNQYAWLLTAYARDYLVELKKATAVALG
jgi:hypothetical protein